MENNLNNEAESQDLTNNSEVLISEHHSHLHVVIAVLAAVIVVLVVYVLYTAGTPSATENPVPVACTMDAMECADGSFVGRTGPNCEFVCPLAEEVASLKTYSGEGFTFEYDESIFKLFPVTNPLPNDWNTDYAGVKLIAADRAELLGQEKCMTGRDDRMFLCSAEMEGGIVFLTIDKSEDELTDPLYQDLLTGVDISGFENVSKYSMGVEGEGADYYYVALSENRTLVVERTYKVPLPRTFSDLFPSQELFESLFKTLTVK